MEGINIRRLILVEDDPAYAGLIKRFHEEAPKLYQGEAELITLQSLSMLRHVLATNNVSLVIMDLSLPDSHQSQTIEMVGQERKTLPPVYAITGDERIEVRRECIAMGFVGFALKQHVVQSPNFFFASIYNEFLKRLGHG